ncbi:MAG: aldehyde dehydrogenase family protein [Bacteroidota bacterium]|nr:aldehyde dehydrogenase family protein [Candidatus Kapabacteria bacterium]MDW8219701.1 aldehyde dehydrogenase family protein [Bacteroidota bacterium]
MPIVKPDATWEHLVSQVKTLVPEAFSSSGHPLNLICGEWSNPGNSKLFLSPVDGSPLGYYPMLELESGKKAVQAAKEEFFLWSKTDLDTRKARVSACLEELRKHHTLLAYLLVWEIGKPFRQAMVSVERCISGVQWYIDNIEVMLHGRARKPLGLISNIASWNYPMSVLFHAVLVQALAGNSVIAKTPSDGGLFTLTLAFALGRRVGLPLSLISGSGGELSEALVRNDHVDCLAFVGGKSNGRDIAAALYDRNKRYMLEMEGLNAYGIWNFSDWDKLAQQLRKGYEYGKQRCTAYPRFVVQRSLVPDFLDIYLSVVKSLRIGHPLLVEQPDDPAPDLDFGPLINSRKTEELRVLFSDALAHGAICIYQGKLDESRFIPGQDISAYFTPRALMNLPRKAKLYQHEPFGPIDSIVVIDTPEELVEEMNVSNGSLVCSIATDDEAFFQRIAPELRGFKIGHNTLRSRGDKEEVFGGIGQSWKGCFVGGKYLVEAVTIGMPNERLYGNFPDYTLLPEQR